MKNTQKEVNVTENEALKENLRIQKTAYIKQLLERRHTAEDARLERLLQEQNIIDDLRESINNSKWLTAEEDKYNREFQERVNMQVYESNGISEDKLTGMREYRNALYRGGAAALFFLSLVLVVLCGVFHGFQSEICLLALAYAGMEGALLAQDKQRPPVLNFICGIFYILTFPSLLVMFVCYELEFYLYDLFLPYAVILGIFVMILGTISYFLRDPYRQDKKRLRNAKSQIRDIEKLAEKEVRKEQKIREKEDRNHKKQAAREEKKKQKAAEKAGTETPLLESAQSPAPDPAGTASEPAGDASAPTDAAPQTDDTAPAQASISPTLADTSPVPQDAAPAPESTALAPLSIVPDPTDAAPQPEAS